MTRTRSTFLALVAVLLSPMAANADLIEISTTVDSSSNNNTTQITIEYNDADNDLLLTMAELIAIVWEQDNNSGSTFSGTSQPHSLSPSGGIDFGVSNAGELLFASVGYFAFNTTLGQIGIQSFNNGTISYWASCAASPCTGNFSYDTFSVSGVPEPTTLALFGIGLLGMGLARRKTKV